MFCNDGEVRKIEVVVSEYNPAWDEMFEREAAILKKIFDKELLIVYHIGSTAVPNLKAKPIIDMMPVVENIARVDDYNDAMIALGYEPMGEYGIPGRRYFRKGGNKRTHQVHIFQVGSKDITRHLAFRDYLLAHPEKARDYGTLKAILAQQHPDDIEAYSDGKDEFVKKTEKEALAWYKKNCP